MFTISNDLAQSLATILPIIAASLVILFVLINLGIKIRHRFNVKVNCWFCNNWIKVPYENKNGFNCPNCTQYNGFDETGGYNKDIPEQHDELLNLRPLQTLKPNQKPPSNGLCRLCNNNQQLKVYQLANFLPMDEENYDLEIEHFSKQLEKAYKLCSECDNKLKQTLITQHKWILGWKIRQLKQQGFETLKSLENFSGMKILKPSDSTFSSFLSIFLVSMASLILFNALYSTGIFDKSTLNHFYQLYDSINDGFHYILNQTYKFCTYLLYIKTETGSLWRKFINFTLKTKINEDTERGYENLHLTEENMSYFMISLCGFFIQMITSMFITKRKFLKYGNLIFWSFLLVLAWNSYENLRLLVISQVFATVLTIYTILTEKSPLKLQIKQEIQPKTIWNNPTSLQNMFLQAEANEIALSANLSKKSTNEDSFESHSSFESTTSRLTNLNSPRISKLNNSTVFNSPSGFRNVLTSPNVFSDAKSNATYSKKYGTDGFLNLSMDNLSLGTNFVNKSNVFKPIQVNKLVNRPLISPPRLKYDYFKDSQWNNNNKAFLGNNAISRSSSQSSGFISQIPYATSSPNNSVCSDFDYNSLFSEPLTLQKSNKKSLSEFNFRLNSGDSNVYEPS